MTNGQDTTRGQRWSSKHPRRIKREEQAAKQQAAWERKQRVDKLQELTQRSPGSVAVVGSVSRRVDLAGEGGHVMTVDVDTGFNSQRGHYVRVRVSFAAYGIMSNVSEMTVGEYVPAGAFPTDRGEAPICSSHVEFFSEQPRLKDRMAAADLYIASRWDPEWLDRERVRPGDSDE